MMSSFSMSMSWKSYFDHGLLNQLMHDFEQRFDIPVLITAIEDPFLSSLLIILDLGMVHTIHDMWQTEARVSISIKPMSHIIAERHQNGMLLWTLDYESVKERVFSEYYKLYGPELEDEED